MTPVSIPANPPQPNLPSYDATKLETVQEYTADSYQAAWGVAPPWNPALPIKTWFDSTAATLSPWQFATYETIQQINGAYQMAPFSLPANVAAQVNIPPNWPKTSYPNPITPVPMRSLLPNEQLSPVFGVFNQQIVRTDMPQQGMNQTPVQTSANSADPTLARILAGVNAIAGHLGITFLVLLMFSFAVSLHAQTSAKPAPVPTPVVTTSSSDSLPSEGIALGAAYAPGGTPNIAGWVSQWNRISSGFYNYNSFDITSLKQNPYTTQNSARAGIAYFIKSIGPVQVFGLGDAGIATAANSKGTSVGSAFSGGGGGVLPLGKSQDYGLIFCVRVLKTALAGSQNVYELGFAWGK